MRLICFISLSLALSIIINFESTKVLLDKTDYPVLDTLHGQQGSGLQVEREDIQELVEGIMRARVGTCYDA